MSAHKIGRTGLKKRNPQRISESAKRYVRKGRQVHSKLELPGRRPSIGSGEKMALICHRCCELKVLYAMRHWEIAVKIRDEFQLDYTPGISTVAEWLYKAKWALWSDTAELQSQMRMEQFQELEDLKSMWRHRAASEFMHIRRERTVDGERVEVVDQNAFNEQAKALEMLLRIFARQAALLGLDLARIAPGSDGGEMGGEWQMAILQIVNQFNGSAPTKPAEGRTVEPLELGTGDDAVDKL